MKKLKFKQEVGKNGDWTEWIRPRMTNYYMSCCDCGLVHTLNFRVVKVLKVYKNGMKKGEILPKDEFEVEMKVKRNNKLTKQERIKSY